MHEFQFDLNQVAGLNFVQYYNNSDKKLVEDYITI